jgi:NAD(P)-dependent dehydrogenase (short-subunit alcohol dehydrogenase family)
MGKTFFVAGTEGNLTTDLVHAALTKKERVLATLDPRTEMPPIEQDWEGNLRYVPWNRPSPLSARNILLEGVTFLEKIDEAIVVHSAEEDGRPFHELSSADIERALDRSMKGFFFLLRELLGFFQRQKSGLLTLVEYDPAGRLHPLPYASSGTFRALGSALFAQYGNEPFILRGLTSAVTQPEEFARYILESCERPEKTAGRWTKYSGRTGLFGLGRKSP